MKKVGFIAMAMMLVSQVSFAQIFTSSFENWSGPNSPDGWIGNTVAGNATNFTLSNITQSSDAQEGASSCRLQNTSTTHQRFTTSAVNVTQGEAYQITFWAKGAGNVRTSVVTLNPNASTNYASYNQYIAVTNTWTQYTQTVTSPNTSLGEFIISIQSTVDPDHVLIDNVVITTGTVTPNDYVSIYDIQYTTAMSGDSPYIGQTVETSGIVTATYASGYFLQNGVGPWNGIFVFNTTINPSQGDEIELTGNVVEFFGLTQISSVSAHTIVSTANPLPAAAVISTQAANNEQYESVLVRVENATCTNTNAGFGMFRLNTGNGDMLVDDDIYAFTPTLGNGYNAQGVMWFSFGEYKMLPRYESDIETVGFAALDNETLTNVVLYPNPASDVLNINNYEGEVTIFDALGRAVVFAEINATQNQIAVSELVAGVYFVVIDGKTIRFLKR